MDTVYNVFRKANGEDVSLAGVIEMLTISEARRQYSGVSEEDWFELAQKARKAKGKLTNLSWQESYKDDKERPYDEDRIKTFRFEVKSVDKNYSVKTVNKYKKEILLEKKGKPVNPQNSEVFEEVKFNIYQGVWGVDSDIMLTWNVADNQIRSYQNGVDVFLSFTVHCPDADGSYVPSILERSIPIVRSMIDTFLKIQQMKRVMEADGWDINIGKLGEVDLGTGNLLQPLDLSYRRKLTGEMYFSNTDISGVGGPNEGGSPITQRQYSANVAQINTLIGLYNFEQQRLNDEWGTNPDAMGQNIPARRSEEVNQSQIQQANNSTEYIYDGFVSIMKISDRKLAMKVWDIAIFEAGEYKEMDDANIEELMNMEFDVDIDIIPIHERKQRLQQKIDLAIQKGLISLGQSERIEDMDNVKDAALYLIYLENKAQEDAANSKQADIQANAQVQQQSLQMKANADAYVANAKSQGDAYVNDGKLKSEGMNTLIAMVANAYLESMKNGSQIPEEIKPFAAMILREAMATSQNGASQHQSNAAAAQPDPNQQVDPSQQEQMQPDEQPEMQQ